MTNTALRTRLFVVDAFTSVKDKELKGNPAGVLITSRPLEDAVAIAIARRLSLPALALISDPELFSASTFPSQEKDLPIVWLGPTGHFIPLCGHATMAAGILLFSLFASLDKFSFIARSGKRINVQRIGEGATIALPASTELEPLQLASHQQVVDVLRSASSLNESDIVNMGESRANDNNRVMLLVELKTGFDLKNMPVQPEKLLQLPHRGLWLMTGGPEGDASVDIQTRVFFPDVGIPEDHVCGSAHTLFAPYWINRRGQRTSKDVDVSIVSKQVSPRGGLLDLRWNQKWGPDEGICWLTGQGVIQDMGALNV